jgi:hypothetical protein
MEQGLSNREVDMLYVNIFTPQDIVVVRRKPLTIKRMECRPHPACAGVEKWPQPRRLGAPIPTGTPKIVGAQNVMPIMTPPEVKGYEVLRLLEKAP